MWLLPFCLHVNKLDFEAAVEEFSSAAPLVSSICTEKQTSVCPAQSKAQGCVQLLSSVSTYPCGFVCTHKCPCVYLVDPGDDCILSVIRQLLDVSVSRGVPVDAGHHPLHTHHLHSVRHHQRVNEGQVGTLQRHTAASSGLPWTPAPLSKSINTNIDHFVTLAPLCVSAHHFGCVPTLNGQQRHWNDLQDLFSLKRKDMQELNLHFLVTHRKPSVDSMFLRFNISSSVPWWCFIPLWLAFKCTRTAPLTVNTRCKFESFTSASYGRQHRHKAWHSPGLSSQTPGQSDQQPPPTFPFLSHHRSTQKHISAHEHVYMCVCVQHL